MVNFKEDEKLNVLNHSCAHLLAQAVKHLYPQAKFWVGPVVEEGFYYDIDSFYESIISKKIVLFRKIKTSKYRVDDIIYEDKEFLLQDPDGYLLRFNN